MRARRNQNRLIRKVVEAFKVRSDRDSSNIVWRKVSLGTRLSLRSLPNQTTQ